MKKILSALVLFGFLLTGCPGPNTTPQAEKEIEQDPAVYAGSYEGIFDGSFNGEWGATVDETGLFTGQFKDTTTHELLSAKGTVDGFGRLSGVMTNGSYKVDFSGTIKNKKVSGAWKSSFGEGALTGIKVSGASLTINNQSGAVFEQITYGGKVYAKLTPGYSCKIEFKGETQSYIFCKKNGEWVRTKELIILKKGEDKIFTFTDHTLFEPTSPLPEQPEQPSEPEQPSPENDTSLTIINMTSDTLVNISYNYVEFTGLRLSPRQSVRMETKTSQSGYIFFEAEAFPGVKFKTKELVTVEKGQHKTVEITSASITVSE
ncbi:MAG: hypothetical protein P1P65_02205 [Treponema sp.]